MRDNNNNSMAVMVEALGAADVGAVHCAEVRDDGGPAFPCDIYPGEIQPSAGITMRDYFAAKAMQAFIGEHVDAGGDDHLAECSYTVADAMIKARHGGGNRK